MFFFIVLAPCLARQLVVGQKRDISIQASLINDGSLRKSDKSIIIQKLGSIICSPFDPYILIIDGKLFLDHVVWPEYGIVAGIAATIMIRLGMLPHKNVEHEMIQHPCMYQYIATY